MAKDKMQNQTGLILRGSTYYLRVKVPVDLLGHVPHKREILRSLQTKDRRVAVSRLLVERAKLDKEFRQIRATKQPPRVVDDLKPQDIERYRQAWLHDYLSTDEVSRMNDMSGDAYGNTAGWLSGTFPDEVEGALASGDPARRARVVGRQVDRMLAADGLALDKTGDAYQRLVYVILQATSQALQSIAARQGGKIVPTPLPPAPAQHHSASGERLGHLLAYWERQTTRKKKTLHEFATAVRRFTALHGDMPAAEIKKGHVVAFKDSQVAAGLARGTVKKQLGSLGCWRRTNIDHLCRLNIDQGLLLT